MIELKIHQFFENCVDGKQVAIALVVDPRIFKCHHHNCCIQLSKPLEFERIWVMFVLFAIFKKLVFFNSNVLIRHRL